MRVVLFLLLIIVLTISFAAVGLVLLFHSGEVKNLHEVANLVWYGEKVSPQQKAAADFALAAPDTVASMDDALDRLGREYEELQRAKWAAAAQFGQQKAEEENARSAAASAAADSARIAELKSKAASLSADMAKLAAAELDSLPPDSTAAIFKYIPAPSRPWILGKMAKDPRVSYSDSSIVISDEDTKEAVRDYTRMSRSQAGRLLRGMPSPSANKILNNLLPNIQKDIRRKMNRPPPPVKKVEPTPRQGGPDSKVRPSPGGAGRRGRKFPGRESPGEKRVPSSPHA